MTQSKTMSILIMSCDKNIDILLGNLKLFERFWPNCNFPVFVSVENADFKYKNVSTIKTGKLSWSDRIKKSIDSCKTDYVLFTLDDFWIEENVDEKEIDEVLSFMAFGLAVVADSFVPWFFGSEFDYVVPLLKVYSPIIILIVLNNVFGFQVFVPLGKFRLFALTTIVGAVVSAAIGYPLIHFYGSVGAGITALISQTSVLVSSIVILRNVIPFKMVLKSSLNYFLASILMFSFIFVVSIGLNTDGVTTATLCFIGIVVYSAILYLLKDSLFMDFASRIKNTFSSKLS